MEILDFTRITRCLMVAKHSGIEPDAVAERLYPASPHLARTLTKAAVDSEGTDGSLYSPRPAQLAFAAAVTQPSILFQLGGVRVPFTTPLPFLAAGTSFDFVGERLPISVQAESFGTNVFMDRRKIAGIVVASNALLETSQSEAVIQGEMIRRATQGADYRLLNPASDDGSGIRPAAITFGATEIDATSAASIEDFDGVISELISALVAAGSNLANVVLVTSIATAFGLSQQRNTDGTLAYPGVTATGGILAGFKLLTSGYAPGNQIAAVDTDELLVADDGDVSVVTSQNAVIDQNTAPTGTHRVSMFQAESTAIKLVRVVNWRMRRPLIAYASNFAPTLPSFGSP